MSKPDGLLTGLDGMSFIDSVLAMHRTGDHHSQELSASARTMEHFLQCLALKSDLITAPYDVLKAWGGAGMHLLLECSHCLSMKPDFIQQPSHTKQIL